MTVRRKGRKSLSRVHSEIEISLMRGEGSSLLDHVKKFVLYSNDNGKSLLSGLRRYNTGTIFKLLP